MEAMKKLTIALLVIAWCAAAMGQDTKSQETKPQESKPAETKTATNQKIPANSKIFLAPMNGFENDLKSAIQSKKVPVVLVANKDEADYVITGTSETEKAGTAKKVIMLNWHSNEQASITVADNKSGDIVFAYSVNKPSSAHGKRSTAEACAKHLKEQIEGK